MRFPGQYADEETGLHYNNQRYYDPETARYISPDPLGLEPADHDYAYVENPWTSTDVLGLAGCKKTTDELNWNPKSRPTFGHTFSQHGAGDRLTNSLADRARGTGNQQGQWLDNDAAAQFLKGVHDPEAGVREVKIPEGLGQVIMPDGSIREANYARLVPKPDGTYKTAFPILKES